MDGTLKRVFFYCSTFLLMGVLTGQSYMLSAVVFTQQSGQVLHFTDGSS